MSEKQTTPPLLSPDTLGLGSELSSGRMRRWKRTPISDFALEVCQGTDSLWLHLSRPERGGFALRTAYSPGLPLEVTGVEERTPVESKSGVGWEIQAQGAVGAFRIRILVPDTARRLLRSTVFLTPGADLVLPAWPRDLYPVDNEGNPGQTRGIVHAAQRGVNAALVYLSLSEPEFGSLLYFQNLTALNPFYQALESKPDGVVGGHWPELGYQPTCSEEKALPAGQEIVLSDALLCWNEEVRESPRQSARLFLDMLGDIYSHLDHPRSEFHPWLEQSEKTLSGLENSPKATVSHYGARFIRPYTDAEYPDSMVQLTVLLPLMEYACWSKREIALIKELRRGVPRFFDKELGVMRRYLPNVGKEKNPDEVDSWYLYHPLGNLGRLALDGDREARDLFLQSLEFGINVAHHFKYLWPIQFDIQTLEVFQGQRKPGEPGQSDAGGLYAYIMLQAWELTEEQRYLDEARNAIAALSDMEFDLEYQSNLSAWGANACLRLWRITGEDDYRDQSYVFLATFFHNTLFWESELGAAKHYPVFMGATCLHDAPYMAAYECFEAFAAFHEYLTWAQEDVPDSIRLLLSEYCRYTVSRAWYYYPGELPEEILAKEIRNGHIDRSLAFPLEDLYGSGDPPGQVGQEIYGCGAAFIFTTRAYHRLEHAPFQLYCEYPIYDLNESHPDLLLFRVRGVEGFTCRLRLIPEQGEPLPPVRLCIAGRPGPVPVGKPTPEGHLEFTLPARSRIELRWGDAA